jgi:glutathione synthase
MRLGLLVNNIATEKSNYTTTLIAKTAANMGHEVNYISVDQLSYSTQDTVYAKSVRVPDGQHNSLASYLKTLQSTKAIHEQITLDKLDVLWLRNNPAEDVNNRPWARLAGINFGRLAMRHGVIVVNDPDGLNQAVNKMYLQYFPELVRPRAIITRDANDIKDFVKQEGGYAVLKPLSGSGGRNVFLIHPQDKSNINQMIESVSQDGFVIAQEYLKEAKYGDTRMFLLNGKPLKIKNKFAAIHRYRPDDDDIRSNISAGASVQEAKVTPQMLQLAEIISPKLKHDGMFLVGLDIVANKLMEINVFSPGGLVGCERLENTNFCGEIIHSLEQKTALNGHYYRSFNNTEMATL